MNFVGETGFLCRDTTGVTDPITGQNYRSEIEAIINANGFFPIDGSGATFNESAAYGALTYPDTNNLSGSVYAPYDTLSGGKGFCIVRQ